MDSHPAQLIPDASESARTAADVVKVLDLAGAVPGQRLGLNDVLRLFKPGYRALTERLHRSQRDRLVT